MLGIISILVLFVGFGGWGVMSRISGAVVASGQVELQSSRQVVQHLDGGIVDEILVTEGKSVDAGEALIRLDGALLETELAIVESQYFELLARRGRLEAERADATEIAFPPDLIAAAETDAEVEALRDGQQSLFRARTDTITQSLDQLTKQSEQVAAQIDGLDAQEAALTRQRELLEQELVDQRSLLEKGLAQAPRVLALEREAARLDGQIGEIDATRAQAETRRTEIGIESLRLTAARRETAETELRDQGYRELELAERRRSLTEQIARLEIRAPVSGVVHELQVRTPRSVIRPAEPLMYLVPQDRPLVIGARISPINIDEVHPGQQVKLVFSAFSSRTTPEIDGEVSRVSPDAVVDEATRMSYYRAEVTIPPDEMSKLGSLSLIPGMPVEVFIQTGERSPISYLVKPLSDYFNRAFREG
ncbi:MAG: HlyD family type I secretion periplasmic adaptor subunit [Paracoccus sp. (in: a-proteobacteria)]|uniref:HlyD family type I secretion periplasmic adaptor subunit n=1 Tax=Paracoccus sp. TaxID=267 RepID=UPI0026E0DE27|nr:HlyD family type I secretion periplasmic adaptor subunit [Paracoccus sp. (in: a-proteobacteria)]MDO5612385.1 HlyD family type I secretion periplasmic adaptor subunit [Paracoccus sp. (in: a-proteobacteria)]